MRFIYLFCIAFIYCFSFNIQAEEPVSKSRLNKIAIGGHSPTSYHQSQQANKGERQFSYDWKDAKWLFKNAQERDLFVVDPTRYAPAYNGFCANALSLGEGLVKTNGKHWRIIEDRLYLFYSAKGRERWGTNTVEYIAEANEAWQGELDQAR